MVRALVLVACLVAGLLSRAVPADAQERVADPPSLLLTRLEQMLIRGDTGQFRSLFGVGVAEAGIQRYQVDLFLPAAVRAVVRERDRSPLEGVPPGDGFRLVVEFFVATPGRAKILTTGMDIRRPPSGDAASWRIVALEGISSVEGLYRLRLNTEKPLAAKGFKVTSEDLVISLDDGVIFPVQSDEGVTGLVLVGRGDMQFSPTPPAERGQLRIFSGRETLNAAFETAFVRLSPSDYRQQVASLGLADAPSDLRTVRRAQAVFDRSAPKSFNVDLRDLSDDDWYLLPPARDFVAEVDTRRYDTLTFSRSSTQAEDVSLFQRDDRKTIALYPSAAKVAARGRFYTDDAFREYDVLDYNVDVSVVPERQTIQGRTRLAIRVRSTSMTSVTLRLADALVVKSIVSVEYGPLLHLRVRSQDTVLVTLPRVVAQDSDLTLIVTYEGRLPSQDLDVDTVAVTADAAGQDSGQTSFPIEPHYLLSNRTMWYPQNPVADYATATMRVTVPEGYRCVASGEPVRAAQVVALRDGLAQPNGVTYVFRSDQPLRYLAFVVARLNRVSEKTMTIEASRPGADIDKVTVAVESHPRLGGRARQIATQTEDIMRFYSTLVGEVPFPSMTIALVENDLPGGHSPGYFAVVNDPVPTGNASWRGDPAAFEGFPEFFLAHELAHQWWGQALGWKNYHEQWLSEGFSQYFAALYAKQVRGDRVFNDMLRQFRRWSLSQSDQGPIHLGYRLGHIKSDLRVYRAIVYNKGAAVLHMLRRLLGDDLFFDGLRRFYEDRRFQKAGTDDLERALEAVSGRTLDRFFEKWIYGAEIPRISFRSTIADGQVTVRFTQPADNVFDLPVTVTLTLADGRTRDVIVPVMAAEVEQVIPVDAPVRRVQVNQDSAAIAEFDVQ
jgi:hypothetical protein